MQLGMTAPGHGLAAFSKLDAPTQLIGTYPEILGDLRHMLIGRIDDLLAENARQGGLRHAGTPVQLRGGDTVTVEQCSQDGCYVAFLHNLHNAIA
ncbi:hypothetical protein D3C79_805500 [compost metagenome]